MYRNGTRTYGDALIRARTRMRASTRLTDILEGASMTVSQVAMARRVVVAQRQPCLHQVSFRQCILEQRLDTHLHIFGHGNAGARANAHGMAWHGTA